MAAIWRIIMVIESVRRLRKIVAGIKKKLNKGNYTTTGWGCRRSCWSEALEAKNKGDFIRALGAANAWFFDDSEDHV